MEKSLTEIQEYERGIYERWLEYYSGNVRQVAKVLRCSRTTVYNRLKRYGLITLRKKMRKAA